MGATMARRRIDEKKKKRLLAAKQAEAKKSLDTQDLAEQQELKISDNKKQMTKTRGR